MSQIFTWKITINSLIIGVGLAMDAFCVSLADGMNEKNMNKVFQLYVADTFAAFQFFMPLIGYFCVFNLAEKFESFQRYIPWIALILLLYIGGKMLYEGIKGKGETEVAQLTFPVLIVQAIATSIDALSVGFTIADYEGEQALYSCLIIGIVTAILCLIGLNIGKKVGMRYADKATIFGGVILILIGVKIGFF